MQIPDEFKAFASLLDLDLHDGTPDERALIAFGLKHTSCEQKRVVKAYLDDLLSLDAGDKELQKVWFDTGASLFIADHGELRRFLEMIQKEMN